MANIEALTAAYLKRVFKGVTKSETKWQSVRQGVAIIFQSIAKSAISQNMLDDKKIFKYADYFIFFHFQNPVMYQFGNYQRDNRTTFSDNDEDKISTHLSELSLIIKFIENYATVIDEVYAEFFKIDVNDHYQFDLLLQKLMDLTSETLIKNKMTYLPDFLAIIKLFSNEHICMQILDQLEAKLADYTETVIGVRELPIDANNPYNCYKILSGYLYGFAKEHGFEGKAKFIYGLSREHFFSFLNKQWIFKDSAIFGGKAHGIWSHALQWLMIISMQEISKGTFFKNAPLTLYKILGQDSLYKSTYSKPIWDFVFDDEHHQIFCNPNHLTEIILDEESRKRWPILSESFKRRYDKIASKGVENYRVGLRKKHPDAVMGFVKRSF